MDSLFFWWIVYDIGLGGVDSLFLSWIVYFCALIVYDIGLGGVDI